MISVIVVYNDAAVFEAMTCASVARQHGSCELIALDNRDGRYRSAAAAYNAGVQRASGELLFFVHQDVSFAGATWLSDAETLVSGLPDAGVAGVAGARAGSDRSTRTILSNIEDSYPPQRSGHETLSAPQPVDTVDECAFFVPRRLLVNLPFDEETCDGWHLYAVDYALSVRRRGLRAYALPLRLYHRSAGATVRVLGITTYEAAYFRALKKVLAKHADQVDAVHTTCGTWFPRRSILLQRFPPAIVRHMLRNLITGSARG